MLTFTEAQFSAWMGPLLWPFVRVLALFSTLPLFSQRVVPMRLRVAFAGLIVVCAQGSLPPMPALALDHPGVLVVLLQQVLVGMTLGFAVRLVFTAVELAGELIGLQMGLNYATFFDPSSGAQATTTSRFLGATVAAVFISIDGHLATVAALVRSFETFPVGPEPLAFLRAMRPERWGGEIFMLGLWIALPVVAMLLFANLVLGVISRVAQQMNIFAIGFPVTLATGLLGLLVTLPLLQAPFTMALERMFSNWR